MNQVLRRFVPRAPRYVLRPHDRSIVRYAPEHSAGPMSINRTKLLNLSETGMAILVDAHAAPYPGEMLKVELPIPGGDQIAWWATVVRSELFSNHWWSPRSSSQEDQVLVALRFEELPKGHQHAIRKGLESRFIEELKETRARQWLLVKSLWIEHTWQIIGYALCTIAAIVILYWLSRPAPNYDPSKGAPWGQRFQFFNFEKKNEPAFSE